MGVEIKEASIAGGAEVWLTTYLPEALVVFHQSLPSAVRFPLLQHGRSEACFALKCSESFGRGEKRNEVVARISCSRSLFGVFGNASR